MGAGLAVQTIRSSPRGDPSPDRGEILDRDIFGGYHQRGEDEKYIHYEDLQETEDIVSQAEVGDELQVCTICGKDDKYKEFEDVDGFIEYEAEVRLFAFNM